MLSKREWKVIGPLLEKDMRSIKGSREIRKIGLKEALDDFQSEAAEKYFKMTGYRESDWQSIWHHKLSDYGQKCPTCSHLFRSPTARFCANCGYNPQAEKEPSRNHSKPGS